MGRRFLSRATRALRRDPTLEVHVPISPTPAFFHMVECLARSLRAAFGGAYRDAPVIVTVGDAAIDPGVAGRYPWLGPLGVELRWVPPRAFREHSFYATVAARFGHEFRSDVVLFLDADVLVAAPFDELVRDVHRRQHFAGMMALASPFHFVGRPLDWQGVYDHCGLGRAPDLSHEYVGWPYYHTDDPSHRFGPPYFNFGVVCAPAAVMSRVGDHWLPDLVRLRGLSDHILMSQVALTLAVVRLGLPVRALRPRYNFPNEIMLEALHGHELPRAKFVHLWGQIRLNKRSLYRDLAGVRDAVRRTDLRGIERTAQRVLSAIEPDLVFEAPRASASASAA